MLIAVVIWRLGAWPDEKRYAGTWLRSYIVAGIISTALFGLIKVVAVGLDWVPWPSGEWLRFGVSLGDDILAAAWLLATLSLWFVLQQHWLRRYEHKAIQGQSRQEGAVLGVPIRRKEESATRLVDLFKKRAHGTLLDTPESDRLLGQMIEEILTRPLERKESVGMPIPPAPIKRGESAARDRKQFYVLLGTAAWIGLVALSMVYLLAQGGPMPIDSPVAGLRDNPWSYFFALSIPGLALGAVLFWWFGKER